MADDEVYTEEQELNDYNKSKDIVALGVYTKKDVLNHKIELLNRLLKAREDFELPLDDNKQSYDGVFWTVPFSKFKMSLEEFMDWRHGITNFDGVSQPMNIDRGHLKRIWFASEKVWQGYFEVVAVDGNDVFFCKWHPLSKPQAHPRTSFQGYTTKVPDFKGFIQDVK